MSSTPALDVQDLHFTYRRGKEPALHGVELSIEQGAFVGIVGANRAGKSTLCCTFNRIIPVLYRGELAGTVKVLGINTSSAQVADMVAKVGMVFQDFETQILCTSLLHEVAFVMENLGMPRERMLQQAAFWLREMDFDGLENRDPATLSGGQKQRLVLASVLASEPPILILDEPTTDLDPVSTRNLITTLGGLVHRGRTVVLVTHDLDTLATADWIIAMTEGTIADSGSPRALMTRLDTLQRWGVRSPQLARVFSAIGYPEFPATPEAAATRLAELGFTVRPPSIPRTDPAPGREIITVASLRFGYGSSKEVINGLDFAVAEGEFVALLGRNGSGKTTLMNLIAGILKPWGGTVLIKGQSVHLMPPPERAKHVGIVFQNPDHQIFHPSCLDEVAFGLRHIGTPEQAIQDRAMEALAQVNLAEKAAVDPFTMTKGERKKLALAAVLACQPHILLLDEPTTGLDAREQDAIMDILSTLVSHGHTVLFVTHAIALAARYAHRTIVMAEGRMLLDGPPGEALLEGPSLAEAGLITPPVMRLGQLLGVSVQTPEGLAALLVREN